MELSLSVRMRRADDGLGLLFLVVRSAFETRRMPAKDARTPRSLRTVNFSVRVQAPITSVQIEEVEVSIVVEATVVY